METDYRPVKGCVFELAGVLKGCMELDRIFESIFLVLVFLFSQTFDCGAITIGL